MFAEYETEKIHVDKLGITNSQNKKVTACGIFTVSYLKPLLYQWSSSLEPSEKGYVQVEFVSTASLQDKISQQFVDFGYLQSLPEYDSLFSCSDVDSNRNAIFQIECNLHGLFMQTSFTPKQLALIQNQRKQTKKSKTKGLERVNPLECPDLEQVYAMHPHLQTARACLGVGGGTILRLYAPFYNPQMPTEQWRQSEARKVFH